MGGAFCPGGLAPSSSGGFSFPSLRSPRPAGPSTRPPGPCTRTLQRASCFTCCTVDPGSISARLGFVMVSDDQKLYWVEEGLRPPTEHGKVWARKARHPSGHAPPDKHFATH